jgi:hypothetical protein
VGISAQAQGIVTISQVFGLFDALSAFGHLLYSPVMKRLQTMVDSGGLRAAAQKLPPQLV